MLNSELVSGGKGRCCSCSTLQSKLELTEAELGAALQRLSDHKSRSAVREGQLHDELKRLRYELSMFRRGAIVSPMQGPPSYNAVGRFDHYVSDQHESPIRKDQNEQVYPVADWDDEHLTSYSPPDKFDRSTRQSIEDRSTRLPEHHVADGTSPSAPSPVCAQSREPAKKWAPSLSFFQSLQELVFMDGIREESRTELVRELVLREILEQANAMLRTREASIRP